MDRKLILVLTLSIFVWGCSSGEKKADSAEKSKAIESRRQENLESNDSTDIAATTTKSTSAVEDSSYGALSKAISANNDESIYRASIDILHQNANDLRALNALGMYHYRKGHYPAAEYFFKKAYKVNPQSTELLNNLGLLALIQGERREATGYFRKALAIDSQNSIAAANIGSIYVEDKDYTKAQVALEIAYKKLSRDFKIMNNYAVVLTANGKYEKAKEIYREVLRGNETQKEVLFNYSILLIDHLKQYSEGMDIINKLKFHGVTAEMKSKVAAMEIAAKSVAK